VVPRQKTRRSARMPEQMSFVLEEEGEAHPEPAQGSKPSTAADPNRTMRALTQSLMEQVVSADNMRQALRRVRSNGGSAGIDGMGVDQLHGYLLTHWPRIRQELVEGGYHPQAVRRVEIPKPDGGVRLLGIPTVLDRLVQQALLQVLTPLYDPGFSSSSYGFRPGRSAHMAVTTAKKHIAEGRNWVVDLDLEKYFDRVNHDILMSRLAKRTGDVRVLSLVRRYLEAGVLLCGVVVTSEEGTPQGGPLSPLLANILLDELDKELARRGHRFCRYADDCNIYVRSKRAGERTMVSVTRFLETRLKLTVNRQKSAVDHPARRKFLGFTLARHKGEVRQWIAAKSKKRMMEKVRAITKRNRGISLDRMLAELRRFTDGWVAYFWRARTPSVFQDLDSWIRRRLRCFQWKQWKGWRNRAKQLVKEGVGRWLAYGVAFKGYGPWHVAGTPAMTRVLSNAKLQTLGYASLYERYLSFASA
jgi:RNA-directed DNA polymerase